MLASPNWKLRSLCWLDAWDILKSLFNVESSASIATHIGMQLLNESAIGVNRLRIRGSLANQGFSTANGLSFLAADETIHELLDSCTVEEYKEAQEKIFHLRAIQGHYSAEQVFAIDPHRIISTTKRISPAKKKKPDAPATKNDSDVLLCRCKYRTAGAIYQWLQWQKMFFSYNRINGNDKKSRNLKRIIYS